MFILLIELLHVVVVALFKCFSTQWRFTSLWSNFLSLSISLLDKKKHSNILFATFFRFNWKRKRLFTSFVFVAFFRQRDFELRFKSWWRLLRFCFQFLVYAIWLAKKLAPLSQPIRSQIIPIVTWAHAFSRSWRRLQVFSWSSDWFNGKFVSVIVHSGYSIFGLKVLNLKSLYLVSYVTFCKWSFSGWAMPRRIE